MQYAGGIASRRATAKPIRLLRSLLHPQLHHIGQPRDEFAKAAMEYIGLSEEAVEWLHSGLDDFECDGAGLDEQTKKENRDTASALIQNRAFTKMIHHLKEISQEAYWEKILKILRLWGQQCVAQISSQAE